LSSGFPGLSLSAFLVRVFNVEIFGRSISTSCARRGLDARCRARLRQKRFIAEAVRRKRPLAVADRGAQPMEARRRRRLPELADERAATLHLRLRTDHSCLPTTTSSRPAIQVRPVTPRRTWPIGLFENPNAHNPAPIALSAFFVLARTTTHCRSFSLRSAIVTVMPLSAWDTAPIKGRLCRLPM